MGKRFVGIVQAGYGVGARVMGDPQLAARQAHHFTGFKPIPGTLNVRLLPWLARDGIRAVVRSTARDWPEPHSRSRHPASGTFAPKRTRPPYNANSVLTPTPPERYCVR